MDYLLYILKNTMDHLYKKSKFAPIWFDDVECVLFDGNTLVLNVNNDIKRSFLKGSAGQHLKAALKELYQLDVTVVVLDEKPLIDTSRINENISAAEVIHTICEVFGITEGKFYDPDAKAPANLAFRTAMFFLAQLKFTLPDIAQLLSRDESTVDYGIRSIACRIRENDQDMLKMVDEIRIKLEQLSAEEL